MRKEKIMAIGFSTGYWLRDDPIYKLIKEFWILRQPEWDGYEKLSQVVDQDYEMFIQRYPNEQTEQWKTYEDYNRAFNLFYGEQYDLFFYQQSRKLIANLNQFWNSELSQDLVLFIDQQEEKGICGYETARALFAKLNQNTILNHNFKIEQNQTCFGKTQTELLEQEFSQKKENTNGR